MIIKTIQILFLLWGLHAIGSSQNDTIPHQSSPLNFTYLFDATELESIACYRIPALITAGNGDLVAAIDQRVPSCGDLKWSRDINIVIKRSQDNGKNWSEEEMIVDYPLGQSASDPSLILDRQTDELFLFFNYMDLDKEKDIYYLRYIKSGDHGKSWSEPKDITSEITKKEWKKDFMFITSGRGYQTSDGKLIHTLVNLQYGLHLFASDDHGKSWYLIDTAILPADESKFVELSDGSWMINSRVRNAGYRYVHRSTDQGKSWTSQVDSMLIDPACNASLIRYSPVSGQENQKMLLFSNAGDSKDRKNLTLRVSLDDGNTWPIEKVIYPGPAAYSSLTVLENGDIGVFFEKDNYSQNVFVVVPFGYIMENN